MVVLVILEKTVEQLCGLLIHLKNHKEIVCWWERFTREIQCPGVLFSISGNHPGENHLINDFFLLLHLSAAQHSPK